MKAVVLAGGRQLPSPRVRQLAADAQLVVAADSGLRHARPLGLSPAAVIGDFDSVADEDLEAHSAIARYRYPERKDHLDLELALEWAIGQGATELVVLGAFGSRMDQSLACLLVGLRLRRRGLAISLHDGERDAHPLIAGDDLQLALPDGTVFSMLALEESRCSVTGAEYPLSRTVLPFGVGLGLANVARGGPRVRLHEGSTALIVEWSATEGVP